MSIDLRSDTLTRPCKAMRKAMAEAQVGDDVYGEDPTIRALEARAAEIIGKESALFVPSGTMANQIAIRVHTTPGDALLHGEDAHVRLYEAGAAAALWGVESLQLGRGGFFDGQDVARAILPDDPHYPVVRLLCLENTHNRSGGRIWPLERQREVAAAARAHDLAIHLDGARIFNAQIASGIPARELAEPFDSVAFCLSKGLGAPVGSLVCGSRAFIGRARRARKMLGGGMRQAGILAAAGIWALDNNIERLAEDHANARRLAEGIATTQGLRLLAEPETNIVIFTCSAPQALVAALRARGVLVSELGGGLIRAVTHLDVGRDDIEATIAALPEAASALSCTH